MQSTSTTITIELDPTPQELLRHINGLSPCSADLAEAAQRAPKDTVLYCDRYHVPRIFKYIPQFPPLPHGGGIGGEYVYFYGFATTQETLVSIYHKHSHMVGPCTNPSLLTYAALGLYILKSKLVRYRGAYFVNGKVDEAALKDPKLIVEIGEEKMLRIIAVACTKNLKYFYQRPSLNQMGSFKTHLGIEPRWFKSVTPGCQGWGELGVSGDENILFEAQMAPSYTCMFRLYCFPRLAVNSHKDFLMALEVVVGIICGVVSDSLA
ncbi:hypothetical protein F5146DRAFT_997625 [Armillaria mellea]|nr:hypothetical protein F5146DRAFT_997625 [Armillaria mellea]